MSTFHTNITLNNQSNTTLVLNEGQSSGLSGGSWPQQIDANTQLPAFTQGWDFQIKFVAWYEGGGASIGFQFYADGVEVFDCGIQRNPGNAFPESDASNNGPSQVTFNVAGTP